MDVTLQGQYQHLITGYALDVKNYDQHRPLAVSFFTIKINIWAQTCHVRHVDLKPWL